MHKKTLDAAELDGVPYSALSQALVMPQATVSRDGSLHLKLVSDGLNDPNRALTAPVAFGHTGNASAGSLCALSNLGGCFPEMP